MRAAAAAVPAVPACAPVGDLAPWPPAECDCSCGARLHAVPAGGADWSWLDEAHRSSVLTELGEVIAANPTFWDDLARDDIALYSVLSARDRLEMLATRHHHRPARRIAPAAGSAPPRRPPECCGQPMMAAPAGWRCRVRRTVTDYDTSVHPPTSLETA